jgi:hypothetical protein
MNFKSIFSVLMLSAGLTANSYTAYAGNDGTQINVPTTVTVEDIATEWDMPKNMRSGNTSKEVNTLAINGFDMKAGSEGKFNLTLSLPVTAVTYIRIVDASGYDVYFETVKNSTSFSKQLDLSSLSAGTYYLQVTQKGKTFNKRLIFN